MVRNEEITSKVSRLHEYDVAGCAHYMAPTLLHVALLSCGQSEAVELPECLPFGGEWGENDSVAFMDDSFHHLPLGVHIIYLSVIERKFYMVNDSLPQACICKLWEHTNPDTGELLYDKVIVGMAPYGGVAVWLFGLDKETLISWTHGREMDISMEQFLPYNPDATLSDVCRFYINSDPCVRENLRKNGLPPRDLFDNYMKQFTYRYQVMFGQWDEENKTWSLDCKSSQTENQFLQAGDTDSGAAATPQFELDYIEEALFDGTHDKLHDGGLMKYHEAGKPKKLAVKWHAGKREWTAYFWFEGEEIRRVFDRFYGAHPETKTDFIIRIDPEKDKYELALFRYGLPEPHVIPEKVFQLLVFRNKFECYRSYNYNQERGAWIW